MQADYECDISIEDDGTCIVMGTNQEHIDTVLETVEAYSMVPEVGATYDAEVVSIQSYGAFVKIAPGKEGLLHISELSWSRVEKVEDVLKAGQKISVKLTKIDDMKRINFSMKALMKRPEKKAE